MKMWKQATLIFSTLVIAGCGTKAPPKETVVAPLPPLIVADATPIVSKTKKSIGVDMQFKNISADSYRYARFKVTAYDKTGKTINPKKGNRESAYLRIAGPISPGQQKLHNWSNTWANKNVQCLILDEVEIIFMDGSVELAKEDRLLQEKSPNSCI